MKPLTIELSTKRQNVLACVAAWPSSGPLCYRRCTMYQTMLYACANLSSRPTLQQAECLRSASLSGNTSRALDVIQAKNAVLSLDYLMVGDVQALRKTVLSRRAVVPWGCKAPLAPPKPAVIELPQQIQEVPFLSSLA